MEGKDDLYSILGVSRTADTKEIRQAYKELSKQHHPDKGGDEELFKKISHAHEVLSDENKRQMYDITGSEQEGGGPGGFHGFPFGFGGPGMPGGVFHMNVDINDLFGNMFGSSSRDGKGPLREIRKPKGPNKVHEIPLSLEDFYKGKNLHMDLDRKVFCDICHGDGCSNWKTCEHCKGTGSKETMMQLGPGFMSIQRGPCVSCEGEGRHRGKECAVCDGKGLIKQPKGIDVKVLPGSLPGDILIFEGLCSDQVGFEKPGDIILRLVSADEELDIEREGEHLKSSFTICLMESLLGCKRKIEDHPGFEDGLEVTIPAGVQHGETICVKEKGMPCKVLSGFGDLFVTIRVVIKEEEKKALETHKAVLQSIFL